MTTKPAEQLEQRPEGGWQGGAVSFSRTRCGCGCGCGQDSMAARRAHRSMQLQWHARRLPFMKANSSNENDTVVAFLHHFGPSARASKRNVRPSSCVYHLAATRLHIGVCEHDEGSRRQGRARMNTLGGGDTFRRDRRCARLRCPPEATHVRCARLEEKQMPLEPVFVSSVGKTKQKT